MCGRFALHSPSSRIERIFEIEAIREWETDRPVWNIPPTTRIPAVLIEEDERQLDLFRWGLVPYWVKDLSSLRAATHNARAEDIATKPMFRSAFKSRRVLIPADAFYEWRKTGDRQPYLFERVDGDPMAFAGLWEAWRHPEGQWIRSCTMVTTEANADMSDVHDRMPVVLERDTWDRWLDPGLRDRDELEAMLRPGAVGTLEHHPVDRRVGSVKNDDAELLLPPAMETLF